MKKNRKMLGLAAAALLAVAPVATSVVPTVGANTVQADAKTDANSSITVGGPQTSTPSATTDVYYFAYNGNQTVPQINASKYTTLGDIQKNIEDNVTLSTNVNAQQKVSVSLDVIASQLKNQGATITGTGNYTADTKVTLPANFNIQLVYSASNGKTVSITIPYYTTSTPGQVTDAPQFNVRENDGNVTAATNNATYSIAAGSTFNPLDFTDITGNRYRFSAQQSSANSVAINVSVSSNPVDTSQEGRFYTVTLTATNAIGKTATYSYQVLIVANGQQEVYSDTTTYSIYGNVAQATGNTIKAGTKVYVGSEVKTINKISYTKISTTSKADANSSNSNLWIPTTALSKQTTTDANAETHTVMIDSRAYDKNGNYLGHMYYAYDDIKIVPTVVTINGKTYYKVADKDEYVRVTNITGNTRTLTHNAYIYWSSYRRTPGTGKMYKGQTVTTYGPAMRFKNGKKYYRIEGCRNNNKRYIKAANLSAAQ
ncbi:MAG: SLAP domain-containing protein [Lactobacillus sp.]